MGSLFPFQMILFFLLILYQHCSVNGKFNLQVQFHRYNNPSRRVANGNCCEWIPFLGCQPCETLFRTLCLRNGGISSSTGGQCISGTSTNPGRVGSDSIEFGNTIGDSHSNPFTYTRTEPIPQGGYQLHLEVYDDDLFSDDFIDRMIVPIPGHPSSVQSGSYVGVYNKASLVLSYTLSCAQHYYSTDCSVNCIPHNDAVNGHYTCNVTTGALVCRSGWQNTANNCRDVACHLVCTSPGGQCTSGVCQCNSGWSGPQCAIPQCTEGCHSTGGYCNVPNTCLCHTNWNGTNCDMALCAVNCSSIGGICAVPNQCTCLSGYTGQTCDIDMLPCDHQRPCRNNGTCTHTQSIGQYSCQCPIGYTGINCETDIDECSIDLCQNNGTCVNGEPGSYRCICTSGWTGDNCTNAIDYCQSNPCINDGTCTNQVTTGSYYCHCSIQYEGLNCELTINACLPNPCQNNGTCMDLITSYTCTCLEGYSGRDCESISSSYPATLLFTYETLSLQYTTSTYKSIPHSSYLSLTSNNINTVTNSKSIPLNTNNGLLITTTSSGSSNSRLSTTSKVSITSSTVQRPLPSVGTLGQSSITVSVTGGIAGLLLLIIIGIFITVITLACVLKKRKQLHNQANKIQKSHYYVDDKSTCFNGDTIAPIKTTLIPSDYEEPRVLKELHNAVYETTNNKEELNNPVDGLANPVYCQTGEEYKTVPNSLYDEGALEHSEYGQRTIPNPLYGDNATNAIPNPVYKSTVGYKSVPNPVYEDSTLERKKGALPTSLNATYRDIPNPAYGNTPERRADNQREHTYEQLPSLMGSIQVEKTNNYDYIDLKRSPQPVVMDTNHTYDYIHNN